MDIVTKEDEVPNLFEKALQELELLEGSTSNLSSDAFGTPVETNNVFHHQHLTKEVVITELDNLEYYEKIALAFLLYDDVNYILQSLMITERARLAGSLITTSFLSSWVTVQRDGTWEKKLLEAFCIIQNYQVLQKLGFVKDDLKARFLPRSPESSLYVNCIRKALYYVCESLHAEQLDELVRRVKEDYRHSHGEEISETFCSEYMEVNILYWSHLGYISLGDEHGRGVDVHRLKMQLKAMGELALVEIIESSVKATVNASVGYVIGANQTDDISLQSSSVGSLMETSSISQHSVASSCSQLESPGDHQYYVDPDNVGYCVIINQKNFFEEPNSCLQHELPDYELEPRLGTDVDRDRLSETFNSLGFTVWITQNVTHGDLLGSVKSAIDEFVKKEHSCFVLCILSHGIQGRVYGSNSIPVYVDELENLMKECPKLIGKPKILIIQACQGKTQQDAVLCEDVKADGPVFSKAKSTDCMTFWSTVPGFASFRHEIEGTWFIQAICQQLLCASPTCDLYKLFTSVIREVSSQRACVRRKYKTMVPMFTSTFTHSLVLPLHPRAKVKVSQRMFERHMFNALLREYIEDRKQITEEKIKIKKSLQKTK